jgi:hypothetical protein
VYTASEHRKQSSEADKKFTKAETKETGYEGDSNVPHLLISAADNMSVATNE